MTAELRTDVTKTRKDGSRGRLRYDYGDHRDPQAAIAWLWKFLDAAKTAGELYGRALVVIAAEQYAARLVVPASQRMPATRWSSHKDIAAKALRKLAGPHAPASLTKLEQAVKRAHAAYDRPSAPPASASGRKPPRTYRATTRTSPRRRAGPAVRGPTRRPRVARPGGRAGGGDRPAHRRGPPTSRRPTMSRRFNRRALTDAERAARRQADRERIQPAARALPARAGSAGSRSARPTVSRATASATSG